MESSFNKYNLSRFACEQRSRAAQNRDCFQHFSEQQRTRDFLKGDAVKDGSTDCTSAALGKAAAGARADF